VGTGSILIVKGASETAESIVIDTSAWVAIRYAIFNGLKITQEVWGKVEEGWGGGGKNRKSGREDTR